MERLEAAETEEERTQELHLRVDGIIPSDSPTGDFHRRIIEHFDEDQRIERVHVVSDEDEADEVVQMASPWI